MQFYVPIDAVKSFTTETGETAWEFEGIASTSDVDLVDEVVYPESYRDTVEFFKSNGKIFFDHDYAKNDSWMSNFNFTKEEILDLKTPIGKPTEAEIRPEGLYIKGVLNKSHPIAQRVWNQFLNNPDGEFQEQLGLSIGAKYKGTPRREYDIKKGKYVTYLPDLLLYEVSLTPQPVNPYTWATALKSFAGAAEESETSYHTISPENVLFDSENGKLVVKSVVQGEGGKVHIFEQYIDVKEDVKNVDNEKIVLKADFEEEEELSVMEGLPAEEEAVEEAVAGEVAEDAAEVAGEAEELSEALGEDVAEEPFVEEAVEEPVGEGEAEGLLDALVEVDEVSEGDGDAAMQLIMDKLDILIDLISTSAPAEEAVVEEAAPGDQLEAFKSVLDERLPESGISIDKQSLEDLATVIKSLADDVALKVFERLSTETTVVKSVTAEDGARVPVNPAVALSGEDNSQVPDTVKSVTEITPGEDSKSEVVLKSLVGRYRRISGHSMDKAQARASIVGEAASQLNMTTEQFMLQVRAADFAASRNK